MKKNGCWQSKRTVDFMKRVLIYMMIFNLAVPRSFAAPIDVDTNQPVTSVPILDKAQNGVDIVHIATPTAAGVSSNKFRTYNVPNSGVIMNNSSAIARSQLGGVIHGNPQLLNGKTARLVLFQVTGVGQTQLNGYSEMHGDSADFILSNPNGISINGGGFIGTPRVTLSTGSTGVDAMGQLMPISIERGHIQIMGYGLNADNVDYVSIWSRSMALNAAIYANQADIKLGKNTIDYSNKTITAVANESDDTPAFALDGSKLGSMYANAISLVSTEDGVGVRSHADIVANAGDLILKSNGKLGFNSVNAKGNAQLTAKGTIRQTGVSRADHNLHIESGHDIAINGEFISAGNTLDIHAQGNVRIEKTIEGESKVSFLTAESANISGKNIALNSSDAAVAHTLSLNAKGAAIIQTSQMAADSVNISAAEMVISDSNVFSNDIVSINVAGSIQNHGAIESAGMVNLRSGGELVNHGVIGSAAGLNVFSNNLWNSGELSSWGPVLFSVMNATNLGLIFSDKDITILADEFLYNDADILSFGNLTVQNRKGNQSQGVVNKMGRMESSDSFVIKSRNIQNLGDVKTQLLSADDDGFWVNPSDSKKQWYFLKSEMSVIDGSHRQAIMGSGGNMTLDGNVSNKLSMLASGGDLRITGDLDNQGEDLLANYDVTTLDYEVTGTQKVLDGYNTVKRTRNKSAYYSCWGFFRCKKTVTETYDESMARFRYESVYGWVDKGHSNDTRIVGSIAAVAQAQGKVTVSGVIKNGTISQGVGYPSMFNNKYVPQRVESKSIVTGESGVLFNNSALFKPSLGHRYLIETNTRFIDTQQFVGSLYFLERMGVNINDVRLLGDSFFETRLIGDAIMKLANRRFLKLGIESDADQMRMLYENAMEMANVWGLSVGDELSSNQQAAITKDIVWLINTDVNGHMVLVPRLYLSSETRGQIQNQRNWSAVLAAQTIEGDIHNSGLIHAGGDILADDVQNSGRVVAENSLTVRSNETIHNFGQIQATVMDSNSDALVNRGEILGKNIFIIAQSDISNTGQIQADQSIVAQSGGAITNTGSVHGNDVTIESTQNLINQGGGRLSGAHQLTLQSKSGDIINQSRVKHHRLSGYHADEIDASGVIETQGNLRLISKGDVINYALLSAAGDADISAGGDIRFMANQLDQMVVNDTLLMERSGFQSSSTTIGGHLSANSGKTIQMEGSALVVKGDAAIHAAEDVLIQSNATVGKSNNYDEGYEFSTLRHGASSVLIGGQLAINTAALSIYGSDVMVGGGAELMADKIRVSSVENSQSFKDIVGHGQDARQVQQGARLMVGENIGMVSKSDISIVASEVVSDGGISVKTGGNFNLISAKNTNEYSHSSSTKGFFSLTKKTSYTQEKSMVDHGGFLQTGGSLRVMAKGDVTLRGSELDAHGDASAQAGGNVEFLGSNRTHAVRNQTDTTEVLHAKRKKNQTITVDTVGDVVTVGGDLEIVSAGKLTLYGTNLAAGKLNATADDGVVILAAKKQSISNSESTSKGLFHKKNTTDQTESLDHDASVVASDSDISMVTNGHLTVAGSHISSMGSTKLRSSKDISIVSVADLEKNKSSTESSGFSGVSLTRSRSSIGLNFEYNGSRTETETTSVIQQGSQLSSGGQLVINSGENTIIMASNVVSVDDISVSGASVRLLSAQDTQETIEAHAAIKDTVSFTVGNAWVETAHSAKDAINSTMKAIQASRTIDSSTTEGKINKAAADAQAVMSAIALANSVAQSAGSAATAGFYGSVSASRQESVETTTVRTGQSRGTQLVALNGNLTINAVDAVHVQGSSVTAMQGDVELSGGHLLIESAKDTRHSTVNRSHNQSSAEMFNTAGAVSLPRYTQSETSMDTTDETLLHSLVQAAQGSLIIRSKGDTVVKGAQLQGNEVDVSAGKQLVVSSVQNKMNGSFRSNGIMLGGVLGGENAQRKTSRLWADEQTHILGSKSMKVQADRLVLVGGVVANAAMGPENEGGITDHGNSSIKVNSLHVENLSNWDVSNSFQVGVDVSGVERSFSSGRTSIRLQSDGHRKEGVALATIGRGELWVGQHGSSVLAILNRDISNRNTILVDETTGGLDVDLHLDNQIMADTALYVQNGIQNSLAVVDNSRQALDNGGKAALNLADSVIDNVIGNGKDGIIEDYHGRLRNQELGVQSKRNSALAAAMAQLAEDPKSAQYQLKLVAQEALVANGIKDSAVDIAFYHAEDGMMGGHKDGKIYINLAAQDGRLVTMMEVLGDELSHYVDTQKGRVRSSLQSNNGPTDISRQYGDDAIRQTHGYIGDESADADLQDRLKKNDFTRVNYEVATTNDLQRRITVQVQKVVGNNYHSLIKIVPENQELYKDDPQFKSDKNGQLVLTLGAGPSVGLFSRLKSDYNRPKDLIQTNKVLESVPLIIPSGTEDQKISELRKYHEWYNDHLDYDLFPKAKGAQKWYVPDNGYNSNSYVSGLLMAADLEVPPLHLDINLPGYSKPVPSVYFKSRSPISLL
jgi:filamentous hemagglutinin family protein